MRTQINIASYISLCLLGVYITVYQSVIGTISKEYAIGNAALGIIISLHFIGSIAAPILFGEISDRIGKKPVILAAFGLLIAGLSVIYLVHNLIAVSAGIFMIGCGFAVIEGTLSGLLVEVNPDNPVKVMNYSQMFFSIGAVSGPLVFLAATNRFGSWRSVFLMMIIAFVCILIFITRLRLGESQKTPATGSGLISLQLFKHRLFLYLCAAIFAYVGIEEGVAFWLGSYFEQASDSVSLGAYTLSGYWGSMIIGRYLAGRFSGRNNLFLTGGLLVSLVFVILALLFNGGMASAICFVLTGLGISAVWPIIMSITAEQYPAYSGTALGIMMTFGAGGGTIVPLIMGTASKFTGIEAAFIMIPVIMILVMVVIVQINKWSKLNHKQVYGG